MAQVARSGGSVAGGGLAERLPVAAAAGGGGGSGCRHAAAGLAPSWCRCDDGTRSPVGSLEESAAQRRRVEGGDNRLQVIAFATGRSFMDCRREGNPKFLLRCRHRDTVGKGLCPAGKGSAPSTRVPTCALVLGSHALEQRQQGEPFCLRRLLAASRAQDCQRVSAAPQHNAPSSGALRLVAQLLLCPSREVAPERLVHHSDLWNSAQGGPAHRQGAPSAQTSLASELCTAAAAACRRRTAANVRPTCLLLLLCAVEEKVYASFTKK